MTWTFRAVLALLRGAVVSWLAFSFSAVAGFSLVLCLGHFDCGQWNLEGGLLWLCLGVVAACGLPFLVFGAHPFLFQLCCLLHVYCLGFSSRLGTMDT